MSALQKFISWLGITSPAWMHSAIARRNMPIILVGSIIVAIFAGMLAFCLLTGTHCPVDGFDEAVQESPGTATRFLATSLVEFVLLVIIAVYAALYIRNKWNHPRIATVATAFFAFLVAALWGIAEAGVETSQQILIFASIQFLVAGLLIFDPLVSLAYFIVSFSLFGVMLGAYGDVGRHDSGDLAYLAFLDIVVCWVVYGLFRRSIIREQAVVDKSRRDELTGAKNRHYLRDDFSGYTGKDLVVMLCDIDDFKRYNDKYTHAMGDKVLREFFFALRDAFGDEGTYRYGGDEFLIVQTDHGIEGFDRNVLAVVRQLEKVGVGDEAGVVTYSGGYARGIMSDNAAFREMLREADECLLEAKRAGKNRVVGAEGAIAGAASDDRIAS